MRGRVRVEPTLQLPQHPEVFVIGDAAYVEDRKGQPLPMLATVAQQQAKVAARNLQKILNGESPRAIPIQGPRSARDDRTQRGGRAHLGTFVQRIHRLGDLGGTPHFRLIGFRNRLVVLINWAWDYFFYDNQVRLITRE